MIICDGYPCTGRILDGSKNNISVVNDGTGDAEEVSDVEKKDMEENTDETEKKRRIRCCKKADTEAVKEEVEGSADDEEKERCRHLQVKK